MPGAKINFKNVATDIFPTTSGRTTGLVLQPDFTFEVQKIISPFGYILGQRIFFLNCQKMAVFGNWKMCPNLSCGREQTSSRDITCTARFAKTIRLI